MYQRKSQIADGKKPALNAGFLVFGALDRIRTCDRSVRSRVLYPAELRVHLCFYTRSQLVEAKLLTLLQTTLKWCTRQDSNL
ncbi:hypothetical protein EMIT0194MI4_100225 [Pseudomonas sp. IT-194MI4]